MEHTLHFICSVGFTYLAEQLKVKTAKIMIVWVSKPCKDFIKFYIF